MKFTLFTFYFLISTLYLHSQEMFNYSYGNLDQPVLRNIIIQDTSYIAVGGAYSQTKVTVNVFNKLGELNQVKEYGADSISWLHGIENSLKETSTGNYILGGNRGLNYYRDNLLIKFDHNFDTIFTKTYYPVNDGGNSDVLIYNSNIDVDGNYLLVGVTNIDNNYNILPEYQMQLIKTDTLGNLLWRKTYGNSTYKYYGYKVVPAFGGGYLLGGYSNKNGGDNCIIKVDENGENPIVKYFGHSSYNDGRLMGITKTSDNCYIISTGEVFYNDSGYDIFKARIFKLDSNLNIIWDKLYLNYGFAALFVNALEKPNGNLIVHGTNNNTQNRQMMVIMELTADGDSIWKQTTTALDTILSNNYMESGKFTPDGGIVFAGWTTNSTMTPTQQMWLVKTDSLGCDGTQFTCGGSTNIPEFITQNKEAGLRVWPNPTRKSLTLALSKGEGTCSVSSTRGIANNTETSSLFNREGTGLVETINGIADGNETSNIFNRDGEVQTTNSITQTINSTNNASLPPSGELKGAFAKLNIVEKLEYSSKNPNNKLWGEAEKQEMRELQRKYAYMLPFEVINGKQNIFSIDPVFAMSLTLALSKREGTCSVQTTNSITQTINSTNNASLHPSGELKGAFNIIIYDIYGRVAQTSTVCYSEHSEETISIDVSTLQKGVYFVKVGENVARFVKE